MSVLLDFGLVTQATSSLAMRFKNCSLRVMTMIILSLATILMAFSVFCVPQILEFMYMICQPQLWVEAKRFLSQPVLILLVNLVVLFIWVSSGVASNHHSDFGFSNCHSDVMKEANFQLPGTAVNHQLPSPLFSNDKENKAEFSLDCDLQASKVVPNPALSSATSADSAKKQNCIPDKRDHQGGKSIACTYSETKKYPATATKRTKFQGRTPSLPSRVIVRNVSARETEAGQSRASKCKQEVLVMEVNELNERIDAFFARFRERMRQESLRS